MRSQVGMGGHGVPSKGPGCSSWRREGTVRGKGWTAVEAPRCGLRPQGGGCVQVDGSMLGQNWSPGSIQDPCVSLGRGVTRRVKNGLIMGPLQCSGLTSAACKQTRGHWPVSCGCF